MVKREVVGAHYGLRDWLAQRITAVIITLYTLFFFSAVLSLPKFDYWHWKALWMVPVMRYATVLFVVAVGLHAWVGVRNILMDYVKSLSLRLTLYVLVILALISYAAWAVNILWSA
jgi:succinate dehydrogenase / fumarate reductase, membrane anchor subunit